MEQNLIDPGAAVDIDTLMARIRKAAEKRSATTPSPAAPPSTNGANGALQAQADFNLALVESLDSMAVYLQGGHKNLAVLEERIQQGANHTHQVGDLTNRLSSLVQDMDARTIGVTAHSAELERKMSQDLQALDSAWQGHFAALQQRLDLEAAGHAQTVQEMATRIKDLLQDTDAKRNEVTARTAELERKMSQDLQARDSAWQGHFAALQQRLDLEAAGHAQTIQEMAAQIKDLRALLGDECNRVDVLVQKVDALSAQTAQLTQHVNDQAEALRQHQRAKEELGCELSQLEATVKQCDQACKTNLADAAQCQQRTSHELEEMRIRVLRSERKARALTPSEKPTAEPATATAPPAQGAAPMHPPRPVIDYFLFEHRFRGPVADIKRRQQIYLDLFQEKQAVLDVGCGRGEFVELLRDHGVPVTGIDRNEDMAEFCKDRGLPVTRADAFAHLATLSDASLDGIFSAQVVEHLTTEELLTFLGLCAAKLRPEGLLVLETINSNCPPAMSWFYLDPTHVRPVPADLLRFLLEQELFDLRLLRFSSPLPGADVPNVLDAAAGLPAEVAHYQDYAAVACKR